MKAVKQDINVILSPGFQRGKVVDDMIALGVRGFIAKPYTMTDLINSISAVIEDDIIAKQIELAAV